MLNRGLVKGNWTRPLAWAGKRGLATVAATVTRKPRLPALASFRSSSIDCRSGGANALAKMMQLYQTVTATSRTMVLENYGKRESIIGCLELSLRRQSLTCELNEALTVVWMRTRASILWWQTFAASSSCDQRNNGIYKAIILAYRR